MDWNATVDTPEQKSAWEMYKKILREAGQADILSYTYNECIASHAVRKVGFIMMQPRSHRLEVEGSAVRGKVGVMPPHQKNEIQYIVAVELGDGPQSQDYT